MGNKGKEQRREGEKTTEAVREDSHKISMFMLMLKNHASKICHSVTQLKYNLYRPEDMDHNSALTAGAMRKEFYSRTTSQGVSHIYLAPIGGKKVAWLLLTVMTIILLVANLSYLIMSYAQYETISEVKLVSAKILDFPAVTICNNNAVKSKATADKNGLLSGQHRALKLNQVPELGSTLKEDLLQLHRKEDMIIKAKYNDRLIDLEEFEDIIDPVYGKCFTFNKYNDRESRRALSDYGLELLLNLESYAYQTGQSGNRPTQTVAAVVKLHHPDIAPHPEENNVFASPETITRISIKKTLIERLGGRYGECIDNHGTKSNYTRHECEDICLQQAIMEKCCCYVSVIGHHPVDNTTSADCGTAIHPCTDNTTECWNEVWRQYEVNSPNVSCDHCLDPCSEITFNAEVQANKWPNRDPGSLNAVRQEVEQMNYFHRSDIKYYFVRKMYRPPSFLLNDKQTSKNNTSDIEFLFDEAKDLPLRVITNNFVRVQLYYESMNYLSISDVPAVGDFEFASEIGGTLGLWVGWTILTVFEFFELLFDLAVLRIIKRRKKSAHNGATDGAAPTTANTQREKDPTIPHSISTITI